MIDDIKYNVTSNLLEVVIYAIGIGIAVRVLAFLWRYFWNIETSSYEGGALVGGVGAILAVWGIERGPRIAISVSATIIVAFFLSKLIRKYIDRGKDK